MIKDCCSWISGFWGSNSATEESTIQRVSERSPLIQQEASRRVSTLPRPVTSVRDYRIAHSNPITTFSHLQTPEGKVCQLVRMTGNSILRISSYPPAPVFPILEDLLSSGMEGKGLPAVSAVCEDREVFIKNSMSPEGFRVEVGETVFYYLQLLLYLNTRGAPFIQSLAPYPYVKDALMKYWDCLFKPMSLAAQAKEKCEEILGKYYKPELNYNGEAERIQEEENKLNDLAVVLKNLVLQSKGSKAEYDCVNNQRLIDLLLDILTLYSGGRPDRVVGSLPEETISFLDKKLGCRTFASESCLPNARSLLDPANLGLG